MSTDTNDTPEPGRAAGFTAGPWTVVDPMPDMNPPSFNVWAEAIDEEDATLCHDVYSEADARLIAAAPTLLAALNADEAFICHIDTCRDCEHPHYCDVGDDLRDTADDLRGRAIEGARGPVVAAADKEGGNGV